MRNRNPGESLPRRFIRLQRARRCRRQPPCPDIERRTFKCAPSPHRPATRVPARFFAATRVSWTSPCRHCPSPRIHQHRDTSVTAPRSSLTPRPDVTTATDLLQCGLPPKLPNYRTQAQPRGAPHATGTPFVRTTFESVRASNRKRLTCTCFTTGVLPPPVSPSAGASTATYSTSNTSPSPTQHASQQETPNGPSGITIVPHFPSWPSQRCRRTGHAPARATASRPEIKVHARRRPTAGRPEGEEKPDLEANCRLLSWSQLWNPAGAILHKA